MEKGLQLEQIGKVFQVLPWILFLDVSLRILGALRGREKVTWATSCYHRAELNSGKEIKCIYLHNYRLESKL